MGYDLGVDLGTTYTCAAIVRDGQMSVCQLGQASQVIPSVVSIRADGAVLTGEAAERRAVTDPALTVREFKRRFGDDAPFIIGGTPYGAEVLTARLLQAVIEQVTAHEGEPPTTVAISHPATWGPFKIDLLAEAARLAGVHDPVFVAEPVAAAVAYAARHPQPESSYLLVYDLGGGTFDAAAVWFGATGPIVAGQPEGLARLGGADFDQAVLAHVDEALAGAVSTLDAGDVEARGAVARLRDDARSAKEALSSDTEAEIPVMLPAVRSSVRLTRAEFEHRIAPRLEDSVGVAQRVLTSAGLVPAHLTAVLLVGGSSRVPLVAQVVRERLGVTVVTGVNPLFAVAEGAALLAGGTTAAAAGVLPAGQPAEPTTGSTPVVAGAAAAGAVGVGAAALAAQPAGAATTAEQVAVGAPTGEHPTVGDPTTGSTPAPPGYPPGGPTGPPTGPTGPYAAPPASPPRRSRRALVAAAIVVLVVLLGGGLAYALTRSNGTDVLSTAAGGPAATASSGTSSTTAATEPGTTTPGTTETTAVDPTATTVAPTTPTTGRSSQPTQPPVTSPPVTQTPTTWATTTPTTTAKPVITSMHTSPKIICFGIVAPTAYDFTVDWATSNAVSVTVSRWSEGEVWEADLPPNGSTTYPVFCDGDRNDETVFVIAKGHDGTTVTKSLTVPISRSPSG